ncbi:hypothetical protein AD01_1574 [Escherichia coli 2-427-07_S4_C2]|nr:hypothetical protein ECOK1_2818 [Escherichia coli IHE3034]EFW50149.1 hypothetical protein SDB_02397 [Shigella dysenteriae CDC 74-1112]KDY46261.1 hypothetical protein AD01_1574 [Escherichia coli 2-427-07_S4_C2]KEJ39376.1 hypothetical protein AB65_3274 [Escherichia coli 2-460-02_S1_C3]
MADWYFACLLWLYIDAAVDATVTATKAMAGLHIIFSPCEICGN